MERQLRHINQLTYESHGTENELFLSQNHNLTIELINGKLMARQINNPVSITSEQERLLGNFFVGNSTQRVNIPPSAIPFFQEGKLEKNQVIENPLCIIFLSSKGLLNESDWTSSQPSEGIWVLAEWLSRNDPLAASLCIDPNMISHEELEKVLRNYGKHAMLGFSPLPVNLKNDAKLICYVKSILPDALSVVGGIGSESLDLIPTKSGKMGIVQALPVDIVVPGTAVIELSQIVKEICKGNIENGEALRDFYRTLVEDLHRKQFDRIAMMKAIQQSREIVRRLFIPEYTKDIIHDTSYKAANGRAVKGNSVSITSLLIDNRCDQGCYFCASPKNQVFSSTAEAVAHIQEKARNAEILSFNDNDLSNNSEQTIELCREMVRRGIHQEKHGKMRADKYSPELIEALADAKFVRLAIGVESFSKNVRDSLGKKNFTQDAIDKTLEHMLRVGIRPEINLIFFTPHETWQSLERTVRESLMWISKGATAYITMGLFATPNSPNVMQLLKSKRLSDKINYAEIFHHGMKEPLLFPEQWKTDSNLEAIKTKLLVWRKEMLKKLTVANGVEMSVPIEAFVALAFLANLFSMESYKTEDEVMSKINEYLGNEITKQYVSI